MVLFPRCAISAFYLKGLVAHSRHIQAVTKARAAHCGVPPRCILVESLEINKDSLGKSLSKDSTQEINKRNLFRVVVTKNMVAKLRFVFSEQKFSSDSTSLCTSYFLTL